MSKIILGKLFKSRHRRAAVASSACLSARRSEARLRALEMRIVSGRSNPNDHSHQKEIAYIHNLHLQYVLMKTAPKLMSKHGTDLLRAHFLNQVVIQNDSLYLAEACKIGVQLSGATREIITKSSLCGNYTRNTLLKQIKLTLR